MGQGQRRVGVRSSLGTNVSSLSPCHVILGKMFTPLSSSFPTNETGGDDDDDGDTRSTGLWQGLNEIAHPTSSLAWFLAYRECSVNYYSPRYCYYPGSTRGTENQDFGVVLIPTSEVRNSHSTEFNLSISQMRTSRQRRKNWLWVSLGASVGTAV